LGFLAVSLPFAGSAWAAGLGKTFTDLLGRASDTSLDRLAQPGAFYDDPAIRIALPLVGGGLGKGLGSALDLGQQFGITDNVVRKLNDAAGAAAREAKPVFRTAIDKLSLADVPGIATQNDGATQYLQRSAGEELRGKLRPLVDTALGQVGAYRQIDALAKKSKLLRGAGITRDRLGSSVTDQALSGIFKYIGAEEGRLRANPLGTAGNVLKGVLGN
jgi:hypothetical protein